MGRYDFRRYCACRTEGQLSKRHLSTGRSFDRLTTNGPFPTLIVPKCLQRGRRDDITPFLHKMPGFLDQ